MELYAAFDLHANSSFLGIVDEEGKRVFKKKLYNASQQTFKSLELFYRLPSLNSFKTTYTTLITPTLTLSVIKEDEPDNRVLECASEGRAQFIVSGDEHHLQPPSPFAGPFFPDLVFSLRVCQ